jgi:hypothetical protein
VTVIFLKDHGEYEDTGEPLYQKGEVACILDDVAKQWIAEGIVRAAHY